MYIMSVLNLVFRDGRPFWNLPEIEANGHCTFDFASPSNEMFILTYYWGYNLIQHRYKYAVNPNIVVNAMLAASLFLWIILLYFSAIANGMNYMYQMFMG